MSIKYHLRDINQEMVDAWKHYFAGQPDVEISCGNIFAEGIKSDAIVSPANSFGIMDGGIDAVYTRHFGEALGKSLREVIQNDYDGELPVGQAIIVSTWNKDIPWMVSAPTMRIPMDIRGTVNPYLAFRAVIREVTRHNSFTPYSYHQIRSVLCPGLGTAIGMVPYFVAAKQMYEAYRICHLKERLLIERNSQALDHHERLRRMV